jgi:hypothetical protein
LESLEEPESIGGLISLEMGDVSKQLGCKMMKLILRSVTLAGLFCSSVAFADEAVSLFNGEDLKGWHTDVPAADDNPEVKPSFIVRDGMLVSLGKPGGHLITDKKHDNFRLELEYRFVNKPGNCGVLVHASTPRALYKMFPASIEVQMNSGHAGDFWCIAENIEVPDMEKRRPKGKNQKSEKPVGEWNKMVIECPGDEIKVWVNGDMVNHGKNCTAKSGQIALQAEGVEVEFKGLTLTQLKKTKD